MDVTELSDEDLILRCFAPGRDHETGWFSDRDSIECTLELAEACSEGLGLYDVTDGRVFEDEDGPRLDGDMVTEGERLEALQELAGRLEGELDGEWEECLEGWLEVAEAAA